MPDICFFYLKDRRDVKCDKLDLKLDLFQVKLYNN
jgi:hypothetical protein